MSAALLFVVLLQGILLSSADPIPTSRRLDQIQKKPSNSSISAACVSKCVDLFPDLGKSLAACGENRACLIQKVGGLSTIFKFLICARKCQANSRPRRSAFRFENVGRAIDGAIDIAHDLKSSFGEQNGFPGSPSFPAINFMAVEENGFIPCFANCVGLDLDKIEELLVKCNIDVECYVSDLGINLFKALSCGWQCLGNKK
eukprot:m.308442 g.308442  ORF g.308442 m.308442 type:complete len:201 (+) comp43994_c0_seq1:69-671(+)